MDTLDTSRDRPESCMARRLRTAHKLSAQSEEGPEAVHCTGLWEDLPQLSIPISSERRPSTLLALSGSRLSGAGGRLSGAGGRLSRAGTSRAQKPDRRFSLALFGGNRKRSCMEDEDLMTARDRPARSVGQRGPAHRTLMTISSGIVLNKIELDPDGFNMPGAHSLPAPGEFGHRKRREAIDCEMDHDTLATFRDAVPAAESGSGSARSAAPVETAKRREQIELKELHSSIRQDAIKRMERKAKREAQPPQPRTLPSALQWSKLPAMIVPRLRAASMLASGGGEPRPRAASELASGMLPDPDVLQASREPVASGQPDQTRRQRARNNSAVFF